MNQQNVKIISIKKFFEAKHPVKVKGIRRWVKNAKQRLLQSYASLFMG